MPRVSVLMPIYNGAQFVLRAVESLLAQSLTNWELIIVDDGSTDETSQYIEIYRQDPRIQIHHHQTNRGLGAALNTGLAHARSPLIAYLPCDDVFYEGHVASLESALVYDPSVVLAYSGVRHHYNRSSFGPIEGFPLQLVQVIHRRIPARWVEREELVTDDLDLMYWSRLRHYGTFAATGDITCEWVDHPVQRHKVIQEPLGGINPYRVRYHVSQPLRFKSSVGNRIDEVEHYRRFRDAPEVETSSHSLRILLVGELAYNPERVLALKERGHTLYGLWMTKPYWYNTVGPVPFGHVADLPRSSWREAVERIKPDVIYALLNWQAVPFVHQIMTENPGIPFVWHFKEGPFICLEKGTWTQLIDLYRHSDGQIYCSPEMRDWFLTVAPDLGDSDQSLILDGDLPKGEWFEGERSPLLSAQDGNLHTVVPGRPIGLHPHTFGELAAQGIHLHFYGDFTHGQWRTWIEKAGQIAPDHLHLHANIDQGEWLQEFSQYDAGWLHFFESENGGEMRRATWDDLNYPARMATLAAAGLPMLQRDNGEAVVATQSLVRRFDIGLFFSTMDELAVQLRDRRRMAQIRDNVWRHRDTFTFDAHADRLIAFFRRVIERAAPHPEGPEPQSARHRR